MQSNPKTTISRLDQLRSDLPKIFAAVNAEPALALAAAANPLLALEELGYVLSPAVAAEIEERARFSKIQIVRRRQAISRVEGLLKGKVDLSSTDAIVDMLSRLGLDDIRPDRDARASGILGFSEAMLSKHRERHPIVEALLDLRGIEAGARQFAPAPIYTKLRSGALTVPGLRLKPKLTTAPEPKPKSGRRAGGRDA